MSLKDDCYSYGRDIPSDDPDAPSIYDSAVTYITNAIPEKDAAANEANPIFCLAVKMLFSYWYDNRPAGDVPDGLHGIVTQLKYSNRNSGRCCQ